MIKGSCKEHSKQIVRKLKAGEDLPQIPSFLEMLKQSAGYSEKERIKKERGVYYKKKHAFKEKQND